MSEQNFFPYPQRCKSGKRLLLVLAGVFIYTGFFTILSILKYHSFFAFSWESVANDNNMVWNTVHGRLFFQSINEWIFDNHLSLVHFFTALFYRVYPKIYTIFFLTHLSLALGALPIFLLARKLFAEERKALFFSFIYLFFNPLHNLSFADQNPVIFSVLPLLFSFYYFQQQRFGLFLCSAVLTMMCQEDLGLVIFMFGIFAILMRRSLKWIIIPVMSGLLWTFLAVEVVLPRLGYEEYLPASALLGGEQRDLIFTIKYILLNPLITLKTLFFKTRLISLAKLFDSPIYFLSFLSPVVLLLALPMISEALLAPQPYFLATESTHHITVLVPFMFVATMYTVKKITHWIRGIKSINVEIAKRIEWLIIVFLFFATILSNFGDNILTEPSYPHRGQRGRVADTRFLGIKNMYDKVFYTQDEDDKIAWKLIELIPAHASVSASGDLLPALSHRKEVYEFGSIREIHDQDGHDLEADFIFLRKKSIYPGFAANEVNNEESIKKVPELIKGGIYEVLAETGSFILLKRNRPYETSD